MNEEVQRRTDTMQVGPTGYLDQPRIADPSSQCRPGVELAWMCCTPADAKQSNPLGSAPVLEDEGSRRLQLVGRTTSDDMSRAADTCDKLCGDHGWR